MLTEHGVCNRVRHYFEIEFFIVLLALSLSLSLSIYLSIYLSPMLCTSFSVYFVVIRLSRLWIVLASAHLSFHGFRARVLRILYCGEELSTQTNLIPDRVQRRRKMNRGMGSLLLTEKLDRNNYAPCSYKMHQYLLGHEYWSCVEGTNDATPDTTLRDFPTW